MTPQTKNQLIISIIFALTLLPFLFALGLKDNPQWLSQGQTNYGQLISPVIPVQPSDFVGYDEFSQKNLTELTGHWLIVNLIPSQHCAPSCMEALLKTKQLRVMLNKELMRTRRVVMLFDETAPELAQQWWLKDSLMWRLKRIDNENATSEEDKMLYEQLLQEQNSMDETLIRRLIGSDNREFALNSDLIRLKPTVDLAKQITAIFKEGIPEGALVLIDPLGNLMMQYESGFDPYKVKNDLMHLLKTSQVG